MAHMWDFNCCGEFKATMKIIQAIFDFGELEKAAKQGEIIRRFLVCAENKTVTLLCSGNTIYAASKVTYTCCTNVLFRLSTTQITGWTQFGLLFRHKLHTTTAHVLYGQKVASTSDFFVSRNCFQLHVLLGIRYSFTYFVASYSTQYFFVYCLNMFLVLIPDWLNSNT